jgi:hypothetical protein
MRSVTTFMGIGFLLAVLAAPVQAEVVVNDSTEIALAAFVPCANDGAGEVVELAGPLHILISTTISGSGISGVAHFQPQGISGTGLVTGDSYRGTGVTMDQFRGSLVNGVFTATLVNNFRIVGQGPGNNFLVHEIFHLTINANGELTVLHDIISIECR